MAELRIVAGGQVGRLFPLDRPRMLMGRHPDCAILIQEGAVSRHHAQITNRDGSFYLEDLKSRNGTLLNGERVTEPVRLADGDVVVICDVTLRFESEAEESSRRPGGLTSRVAALFVDDDAKSQSSITGRLEATLQGSSAGAFISADVKLKAFIELSTNLAKAIAVHDVLPPVMESLFKIFGQAESGFIVLKNPDGSLDPAFAKFRREQEKTVRISRGIINHVMKEREAILSSDAYGDARFELTESIAAFQIRSFMCAPLVTPEGAILGAVQITTGNPRQAFKEGDLEIMVGVVAQAAVAIQNAQLHDAALEQRALQKELELAHEVQLRLLPQSRPVVPGYEFYDYYRAAHRIGGDYYDYLRLPDNRIAILVADVSGHGIPAALLMTKLAAEARFCLAASVHPGDVLTHLNQLLCADNVDDRFVTLVLLILDPVKHSVTIANAGHMAPILRSVEGELTPLADEVTGVTLGFREGAAYRQDTYPLGPDETIVLFTDGVHEAMNEDWDQFGFARLHEGITPPFTTIDELGQRIVDQVRLFVGTHAQSDDICLVCIRRHQAVPVSDTQAEDA
jgi:phosphoserine phosphatase RsbU/P